MSYKVTWKQFVKDLWLLSGNHKWKFALGSIALFVIYLYNLVPPLFLAAVIDFLSKYSPGQDYSFVKYIAIGSGVLHLTVALLRLRLRQSMYELFNEINYEVKLASFSNLVEFSLTWHEQENTGNKVQRIQTGTSALQRFSALLNSGGGGIAQSFAAFIGIVLSFLFLSPLAFMFGLAFIFLFITIHLIFAKQTAWITNERNDQLEKASGNLVEGLSNMLTIKSLGAKDNFHQKIHTTEEISKNYENKLKAIHIRKRYFFHGLMSASFAFFLWFLIEQNVSGLITIGVLGMYYGYFGRLVETTWEFTDVIDELQQIKLAIARLMPIFKPNFAAESGNELFPRNWRSISLNGLTFNYNASKEALKNVNLQFGRHQKVGIVGKSGSGKSTLVKILLGLYKPTSGSYLIGDTPFSEISSSEIHKHISIVLQESELFNDTLLNNITLFQEPDYARLQRAVEIAQLSELVSKLSEGLNSKIGEKGYKLSGGERQRLGIARAIYRDTEIIIFDEATSNLDSQTELLIQKALDKVKKKTMIFIAHRLATLKNTDNIFVFNEGNVVEEGQFQELSNRNGSIFQKLYQAQDLAKK